MEPAPQPPPLKRLPSLKITSSSISISGLGPNSASPATPSQGPPKIKLVTKSQPQTPADARPHPTPRPPAADGPAIDSPAQTKSGRISKPTAKKRARDDHEQDDGGPAPPADGVHHQAKKTKITLKPATPGLVRQPTLKVKAVGRPPHKPLGEGYDSEAEDREVDPVIEEQFLFRMLPGEHCEYVRQMINARLIGVPPSQGGAEFSMKWLDDEGRRAAVTVKGQMFAAILLDLPTITEGMKTWDKKSMVKSADICQMLLVFAPVANEEEARTAPLPKAVEHGHRWPHGITPPMHDARNRRFRKRLSKLEIKNKEAEVERLLASDREAVSTRVEWIDNRRRQDTVDEDEEGEDSEEDAEGEVDDYFGNAVASQRQPEEEEEEDLELDDAALEAEFLETAETPMVDTPGFGADGVTPGTANASTPAPQAEEEAAGAEAEEAEEQVSEEDGDDEDDEDEEEEEDEEGDEDEEVAAIRNEIATLKKQLKSYEDQLAASQQPIMRKRLEGNIRNVKSEILLKMSAIGETEED
ncbi:hypothetical protein VTJ49DRAFT_248 [Mycothermus thermophilus]|uniref:TAFII55 protein conserved region domain-containing protein n=1 Tax=Humicola insolens TaxID=85995 RepID=A0ABR3VGC0_HUMIN